MFAIMTLSSEMTLAKSENGIERSDDFCLNKY